MKKKRVGLTIFLVILAIIILLPVAAYVYLSNFRFEIDDIQTIPSRPTLPLQERFRADAAAGTMDIRLNKSDTAFIVIDAMGLDEIREGLEENDIQFDRFGLTMDDGTVSLVFNGRWKDFLPLPVRIRFRPVCSGSELSFRMEQIHLGEKIRLGGSLIRFIGDVSEAVVDMSSYSAVFSDLVAADAADDNLTVTVAEPLNWLTEETAGKTRMVQWNDFNGTYPLEELISAVENGDGEIQDKWLREIESAPETIVELKLQELAYASNIEIRAYFLNENGEMFERLFPGLDEDAVRALSDDCESRMAFRREQLRVVANEIALQYCAKGIATDGRQFYNLKAKKEPLALSQFTGGEEVEQWLDTSTLRFVFGHVSNTYLDLAPALKRIPTTTKDAFDSIDESQVYVPYLVFISLAGRPVMAYEHSEGNLYLYALSSERYEKVMAGEWIPFIDQRLAPS